METSLECSAPDSAVEERLLARMKQRTEDIAQRALQRRNQQTNRNTELETADAFLAAFHEMKNKLEEDLGRSQDLKEDRDKIMHHFDMMVRDHGYIQEYLNESSMFLASFQMKRSQEILAELDAQIQSQMEALQPKKRFGFRSKPPTKPKEILQPVVDSIESARRTDENNALLDSILQKNFFGFKDERDKTIRVLADEINDRQLNLQNLSNCRICVLGTPGTIQAADLTGCTVIIGPTSRSAFIKRCRDCRFVMACQQVRIHDTNDSHFYLHVTGAAIIESCRDVGFAPYNLEYPDLELHYTHSGLNRTINNWDNVEDFNWISKNEKSPNMFIIEEKDRNESWMDITKEN